MPRSSRVVIAGCAHHVTQRANNRQDVFFVDDDRRVFLALLYTSLTYASGRVNLLYAEGHGLLVSYGPVRLPRLVPI